MTFHLVGRDAQRDRVDAGRGDDQGVGAVGADVEVDDGTPGGEPDGRGAAGEVGEAVEGADLPQQGLPALAVGAAPQAGGVGVRGVLVPGFARVGGAAQLLELPGQRRVVGAQRAQVGAQVERAGEQHAASAFQQGERPLGVAGREGAGGRVPRDAAPAAEPVLLVGAAQLARGQPGQQLDDGLERGHRLPVAAAGRGDVAPQQAGPHPRRHVGVGLAGGLAGGAERCGQVLGAGRVGRVPVVEGQRQRDGVDGAFGGVGRGGAQGAPAQLDRLVEVGGGRAGVRAQAVAGAQGEGEVAEAGLEERLVGGGVGEGGPALLHGPVDRGAVAGAPRQQHQQVAEGGLVGRPPVAASLGPADRGAHQGHGPAQRLGVVVPRVVAAQHGGELGARAREVGARRRDQPERGAARLQGERQVGGGADVVVAEPQRGAELGQHPAARGLGAEPGRPGPLPDLDGLVQVGQVPEPLVPGAQGAHQVGGVLGVGGVSGVGPDGGPQLVDGRLERGRVAGAGVAVQRLAPVGGAVAGALAVVGPRPEHAGGADEDAHDVGGGREPGGRGRGQDDALGRELGQDEARADPGQAVAGGADGALGREAEVRHHQDAEHADRQGPVRHGWARLPLEARTAQPRLGCSAPAEPRNAPSLTRAGERGGCGSRRAEAC
ncbi:thioesterase domain-containing protein [Streptomyces triticirhizae]|uniref:Uncharacterized protein n=1 Tax=Streptomyces triticirhizae TaxID=2483353 RepID=A0A3M2M332_9ACTN|nr:hypothetical protein [Streptomyces triticirhizae]RMI44154.1 hypothetical protein EBN88_06030 [Streptomyces triticirhizae]